MESTTQLIVIVSSALSGVILIYSLSKAGKEAKIRPGLEWARAAVGLTTLLVMGALIGTQTKPAIGFGALAVGGFLGFVQGRQIVVTMKADGPWAVRTLWGIMLWSVGLIAMQLAGLSTRTGAFRFGQAITLFSVAVTVGVIFGRSTPERIARSPAAGIAAATFLLAPLLAVSFLAADSEPADAQSTMYGGVEFPFGDASFADVAYGFNSPPEADAANSNPQNVLGPPDDMGLALGNAEGSTCESPLVVEFVDNYLVDIDGNDLYIFEVGIAVEATSVDISSDGNTWISIGRIEGSTRGVDIGGFTSPGEQFSFVRLCDFPDGETSGAPYPGPDIDAIGAIGAVFRPPEPAPVDAAEGEDSTTRAIPQLTEPIPNPDPTISPQDSQEPTDDAAADTEDSETIDDYEALTASIAAIFAAMGMGVLTLAEGQDILDGLLSGRGGSGTLSGAANPQTMPPPFDPGPPQVPQVQASGNEAPIRPTNFVTPGQQPPPAIPPGSGGTPGWATPEPTAPTPPSSHTEPHGQGNGGRGQADQPGGWWGGEPPQGADTPVGEIAADPHDWWSRETGQAETGPQPQPQPQPAMDGTDGPEEGVERGAPAGQTQTTHERPDGSRVTTTTNPDGTSTTVVEHPGGGTTTTTNEKLTDGSTRETTSGRGTTSTTITHPDGSSETDAVYVTGERVVTHTDAAGNSVRTSHNPNGTTTTTRTLPDGSKEEVYSSPDGTLKTVTAPDGSVTETLADGTIVKTTHTTGQTTQVVTRPDGTIETTTGYHSGYESYEERRPDGSIAWGLSSPDGSGYASIDTDGDGTRDQYQRTAADGSTKAVDYDSDGNRERVERVDADGKTTTTTFPSDDEFREVTEGPDGTTIVNGTRFGDRTELIVTRKPDGSMIERLTGRDGLVREAVTAPDGSRVTTVHGPYSSVLSVTTEHPDGTRTVVTPGRDGGQTTVTTAPDGTSTQI